MRNYNYYKEIVLQMLAFGGLPATPRQVEKMTRYLRDRDRYYNTSNDNSDEFGFGFTMNEKINQEGNKNENGK